MFAVVFEVEPRPERMDDYLDRAAKLAPLLRAMPGFVEVDRFRSGAVPGRLLSLSIWEDEKALIRWRTHPVHHQVQDEARQGIFLDYRLRVGELTADTALPPGDVLPQQRLDATETGSARTLTLQDLATDAPAPPAASAPGLIEQDLYTSIYQPDRRLRLIGWIDDVAASELGDGALRHRRLRVVRDYGMRDRREAPQFYPPV